MASGTTRPNGHEWVFFAYGGKRHTLRFGPIGKAARKEIQRRVTRLVGTRKAGLQLDPELRSWINSLDAAPYKVLANACLVESRVTLTVRQLFAWHRKLLIDNQSAPATVEAFERVEENCIRCWGADRRIEALTPSDGDSLKAWMLARGNVNGSPLAVATASRRISMARQVLRAAVDRKWLPDNPLSHLKRRGERNPERDEYIPWDDIVRIIHMEKTAEFRLLLALVRVCGLRCPSETSILTWEAFDWRLNIFQVKAPKTRRHKPLRDIPIFAQLKTYLADARTAQYPGGLVFPTLPSTSASLTDRLEGLCRKARIVLWPKPFVNMRASAERDMLRTLPIDQVTAYLGHSPTTALEHYSRVAKDLRATAEGRALHLPDLHWDVKQNANAYTPSRAE